MTGNILPNRVNTDHISKVQVPQAKGTISYLKSPRTSTSEQGSLVTSSSAPRGSVSSATDSRKVRIVCCLLLLLLLLFVVVVVIVVLPPLDQYETPINIMPTSLNKCLSTSHIYRGHLD